MRAAIESSDPVREMIYLPPRSTKFVCTSCGFQAPRWYGRCPGCGEWNTLTEEEDSPREERATRKKSGSRPSLLTSGRASETPRFNTGVLEFDRVLGGGFVPGSVVLLAGEPGIGKSTLLLAVSENVAKTGAPVLYISGEESQNQVRLRADRLGVSSDNLYFAAEQDVDAILGMSGNLGPRLLVVDSIQTCEDTSVSSLPGGPTQVRATATKISDYAKESGVAVVLVGHTVKAGGIAGPRVLEHLVDTVLYFEGDANHLYRIVRAQKNRFGPTNEVAVFGMEERGIVEIPNPSEILLSERDATNIGSCVAACLKGNRPLCLEVQALVASTVYGSPRRVTMEMDHGRASLILAVLAKRLVANLDGRDAYVKVAGGIYVDEPGIDLATGIAIMSSYYDMPVKPNLACFGEIGLSGEIRMVSRMEDRVRESLRIGFGQVLVPSSFLKRHPRNPNVKGVSTVDEAVRYALIAETE